MLSEANIQRQILELLKKRGASRLWRNNVGVAMGHVQFGLCKGASDIIGFTSKKVTPDMVGQRVAIFTALEVKAGAKVTEAQQEFIDTVVGAGGIGAVVRSVEDALKEVG